MTEWKNTLSQFDYSELNHEHLNICIETMQDVENNNRNFDMTSWQNFNINLYCYKFCATQEELHNCGTTACFAGHVGLNPKFQKAGGTIDSSGAPKFNKCIGSWAISKFLNIKDIGWFLCLLDNGLYDEDATSVFRKIINGSRITAQHVLDKLFYIKELAR